MVRRWEHKVIVKQTSDYMNEEDEVIWQHEMDELGNVGWEIVAIIPLTDRGGRTAKMAWVFRRSRRLWPRRWPSAILT